MKIKSLIILFTSFVVSGKKDDQNKKEEYPQHLKDYTKENPIEEDPAIIGNKKSKKLNNVIFNSLPVNSNFHLSNEVRKSLAVIDENPVYSKKDTELIRRSAMNINELTGIIRSSINNMIFRKSSQKKNNNINANTDLEGKALKSNINITLNNTIEENNTSRTHENMETNRTTENVDTNRPLNSAKHDDADLCFNQEEEEKTNIDNDYNRKKEKRTMQNNTERVKCKDNQESDISYDQCNTTKTGGIEVVVGNRVQTVEAAYLEGYSINIPDNIEKNKLESIISQTRENIGTCFRITKNTASYICSPVKNCLKVCGKACSELCCDIIESSICDGGLFMCCCSILIILTLIIVGVITSE